MSEKCRRVLRNDFNSSFTTCMKGFNREISVFFPNRGTQCRRLGAKVFTPPLLGIVLERLMPVRGSSSLPRAARSGKLPPESLED